MAELKHGGQEWDKFARQWRSEYKEPKLHDVLGFDTETSKGKCFLIACSDGRYQNVSGIRDALDFLTRDKSRRHLNLFWNLDYDVNAVISYLSEDELYAFYIGNKLDLDDYAIKYIPKKRFSIRTKYRTYSYYDLMQFYQSRLDAAARKYLRMGKKPVDVEKFKSLEWVDSHSDEILGYCIHDAKLTRYLGEYLQSLFHRIDVDFSRPYSHASIAMRYAQYRHPVPHFHWREYQEYALNSYYGGRFECFKRGYFPDAYKYDINSAYPCELAKLPDINFGDWEKVYRVDDRDGIGFIRSDIQTRENYVEPLPVKHESLIKFPQFAENDWFITLDEYNYLVSNDLADVEVKDAWIWEADELHYPFAYMEELYGQRERAKKEGSPLQLPLKIIMNATYGKFVERRRGFVETDDWDDIDLLDVDEKGREHWLKEIKQTGNYYCPVYAALISSRGRLKLLDRLREFKDHLIATFTDSLFLDKGGLKPSREFGGWSFEGEGELILLCSGIYTHKGDNFTRTRLRGIFGRSGVDLFEVLRDNRSKDNVRFMRKRVLKLGETLSFYHKWDVNQFNRFVETQRDISLNSDRKREWLDEFKNCGEVLGNSVNSLPLRFL